MTINGISGYSAQQAARYKAVDQDYSLRWHVRVGWTKKIRGRVYCFEKATLDEALEHYLHEKDWREKRELPTVCDANATTMRELANEFLAAENYGAASLRI